MYSHRIYGVGIFTYMTTININQNHGSVRNTIFPWILSDFPHKNSTYTNHHENHKNQPKPWILDR